MLLLQQGRRMRRLFRTVEGISHWSGEVVKHAIWLMIAILCYEVVARYVFSAPTIWAHHTSQQLFGAYSVLMGAYCLRYGQHIKMDAIYDRFPRRTRAILDSITTLVILIFLGLMLWRGTLSALDSYRIGEVPHAIPFKPLLWPLRATIPLSAALCILQTLTNWARSLTMAFTGKELQ